MIQKEKIAPKGPEFSKLILGLWRLEDVSVSALERLIKVASDHGISTIDQADIYGNYKSQEYFGKLLKANPNLRDNMQLVSKAGIHLGGSKFSKSGIGFYDTSKKHLLESVNTSLKQLHTEYLDLLLIHRPDPLMDPEELDATFFELKKQGKVMHFGVSNFTPAQFEMLKSRMNTPLVTNQIEFSVLNISPIFNGILDHAIKNSYSPMIWSPLAGGRLFTKNTAQANRVKKVLFEIGEEIGATGIDQVALAWINQHPSKAFTIIGTLKAERIVSAVESQKLKLTKEQWFRILVASQGHSVP